MWPLFIGIGVGFLLLLAYGWGLATGVKLGKTQQAREHEALRAVAHAALTAHEREREAWRTSALRSPEDPQLGAEADLSHPAEIAHDRTRKAFLALGAAWGDYGLDDEAPKNTANRDKAAAP